MTKPTVFIDGEAGTTGLQIRERLAALPAVDVLSVDPALRKDEAARANLYEQADVVILCLPDEAAIAATKLADSLGSKAPRLIDASTAHRLAPGWVYGFPELSPGQSTAIVHATHVSNPGCYPTGAIALLRPLIDAGLIPVDYPITINAVSGYSGGGNSMIAAYQSTKTAPAFELYGLALNHKHVPEIATYSGLTRRPIFVPSVGNFHSGMIVSIPLHLDTLQAHPTASGLHDALAAHYANSSHVKVMTPRSDQRLAADKLAGSDQLELSVYGVEALKQAVLVARLDNLGKGAAGAAVQNLKLMLGLE